MVVPSLERRLVDEPARRAPARGAGDRVLVCARRTSASRSRSTASSSARRSSSDARTVVFQVFGPSPLSLRPLADSSPRAGSISNDTVALETARTSRVARGRVERRGRPFAEVAVPLFSGDILLLSTPIEDQLATVRVVKRRLLYATGVALAIAAILGGGRRVPPRAAHPAPRARRQPDRGGRVRRARRRPRRRRARRARRSVRAHARPARAAGHRTQGVRRERVARAPHAAVLARRLPRADGGRGPRRGDARGVPRHDARAGRAAHEALGRPARPLAHGRGPTARGARGGVARGHRHGLLATSSRRSRRRPATR